MKKSLIIIFILISSLSASAQCNIERVSISNKSIQVLNDLLSSLSEFNANYNTNSHIEHICDATKFINLKKYDDAISSIIHHSEKHIEKSKELYKSKKQGFYRQDFKNKLRTIINKIDSISFISCELAYNMCLEISNYNSAHLLTKRIKHFIPINNHFLKKAWKKEEISSYELIAKNDPLKLILFHWKYLKRDTTLNKNYEFIGSENLIKSIQSNFTRDSYSIFLTHLLSNSSISSTSSKNAFLECNISGEKVHFYNPKLSKQIAKDHIFCDTISAYLHKEKDWVSESTWVECDTIRNKLDLNLGMIEYKKIAKKSLLWRIKSRLKN